MQYGYNHLQHAQYIDPVVGAALVTGGANFLGGLLNLGSQSNANETNMAIAQMNNEFNERMLDKQLAYNTEMWNKQNEYNTASAQRERLEQAGLNPYMMMNGGSAGTAQSANPINPPTATPVQVQPIDYQGAFGAVAQSIGQYYQLKNLDAQTKQIETQTDTQKIENRYKALEMVSNILNVVANTDKTKKEALGQFIVNYFLPKTLQGQIDLNNSSTALNNASAVLTAVQALKAHKEYQWMDTQFAAQLAEIASRIDLNTKQGQLLVKQAIKTGAETRGIKLNNDIIERAKDNIVSNYRYQKDVTMNQADVLDQTAKGLKLTNPLIGKSKGMTFGISTPWGGFNYGTQIR